MSIMLNWFSSQRLIIVILLISMALISTVLCQDMAKRGRRRRHRQINCAVYVFAPRCRGVSAKRSSPSLYPMSSYPVIKDVPDAYELLKNSQQVERNSISPLPGLLLPESYSKQAARQPQTLAPQRLHQLQLQQQQQQQQLPSLRSLLQHLKNSILRRKLQEVDDEVSRERLQVSAESLADILFPDNLDEDSLL